MAGGQIAGRVAALIGQVTRRDPAAIDLATRWSAHGLDSLDLLDLFVTCEREFAIAIPDEELPRLRCGGDLVALIQARVGHPRPDPGAGATDEATDTLALSGPTDDLPLP